VWSIVFHSASCCVWQDHLTAKQAPYVPVAENGSWVFKVVRQVCRLHPLYYVSTASLSQMFIQAVKSRDRGRACPGKICCSN